MDTSPVPVEKTSPFTPIKSPISNNFSNCLYFSLSSPPSSFLLIYNWMVPTLSCNFANGPRWPMKRPAICTSFALYSPSAFPFASAKNASRFTLVPFASTSSAIGKPAASSSFFNKLATFPLLLNMASLNFSANSGVKSLITSNSFARFCLNSAVVMAVD